MPEIIRDSQKVMMEVKPFKAFRYNRDVVGDVGSCLAPPYDVISPAQQRQLYNKSEYNIIRIIKGEQKDSDNNSNNQYTRAADYFNKWTQEGVLKQDADETIYAYVQDFEVAGRNFQRRGFIGLARLEEFGKMVQPHEYTLEPPKVDRLKLAKATEGVFGLVFMLYQDEKKVADGIIENAVRDEALIDFYDEQKVRHRLYAITSKENIDAMTEMMQDKSCIIADGHHRYETALNYQKETNNPAADYQMTAFFNTFHKGLIVLATHRLIDNVQNFYFGELLTGLEEYFEITKHSFDSPASKADARRKMLSQMKAEYNSNKNSFGIYAADSAFYVATLKDKSVMDTIAPNKSSAFRALDVSVLHKMILEKMLGIDKQKLSSGGHIEYVKDTDDAVDKSIGAVDEDTKQTAFFMNPAKIQQIEMVVDAGEKMPQKSTFFYPKVYSGLTISKL
ncbi:DUF1015 domain-containing protein [Planctomycetota bacterium]